MSLRQFLDKHRCTTGPSHTGIGIWQGKYHIPISNLTKFYDLYLEEFNKSGTLCFTECHEDVSPILIDLDFKFPTNVTTRLYTLDTIKSVISAYNDSITKHFGEQDLRSFAFEKNSIKNTQDYVKDGIHIIYPYVVLDKRNNLKLRESVLQKLKHESVFKDLKLENTYDQVLDKAVVTNNWFLYLSGKPNNEHYKLTYIFDNNLESIPVELSNREIIELCSIRNKMATFENQEKDEDHVKVNNLVDEKQEFGNVFDDVEFASKLVDILSSDRADDYTEWTELGICLKNIDESLLQSWISFSKKSNKYEEGCCESKWNTFKSNGKLQLGTLCFWAKNDNKDQYEKLKMQNVRTILINSLSGTHYDVAYLLFSLYKDAYVCGTLRDGGLWYEFKNHRWQRIEKGISLKQKISCELVQKYRELSYYYKKMMIDGDKDKIEENNAMHKKCEEMIKKVKNTTFKESVMKECSLLFYDVDFLNKLDTNIFLLGFENGVYDLQNLVFRDGRPDDYLSFTTDMQYLPLSKCSEESKEEIHNFLNKILVKEDIREYVLRLLASILSGSTGDQKFHFWTGTGGNGKSILIQLFEACLGQYTEKLSISILTQKRAASSSATPELVKTKGVRFICLQEPEQRDTMNIGYLKELTGGDVITARGLYADTIKFKPQFKMILCCNDFPEIPSTDNGTWRRIRVVPFESKFVDNPDPKEPLEFKKDTLLAEKLELFKETFMSILIDKYHTLKNESFNLCEPNEVKDHTKRYRINSDKYLDYISENLIKTNSPKDLLSTKILYSHFKDWYQEAHATKAPSQKEFKENMNKHLGKITKRGWSNYKFIEESNEEHDL